MYMLHVFICVYMRRVYFCCFYVITKSTFISDQMTSRHPTTWLRLVQADLETPGRWPESNVQKLETMETSAMTKLPRMMPANNVVSSVQWCSRSAGAWSISIIGLIVASMNIVEVLLTTARHPFAASWRFWLANVQPAEWSCSGDHRFSVVSTLSL